jgi:hypothetical protein
MSNPQGRKHPQYTLPNKTLSRIFPHRKIKKISPT